MNLDWNHERFRTRDRLLEYDINIMPPHPRAAQLSVIYPWEQTPLGILSKQLYLLAAQSGYLGDESMFKLHFGEYLMHKEQIIYDLYINFPEEGE